MPQLKKIHTWSLGLLSISILFFAIGNFPGMVEKYYSGGIYIYISNILRSVSGLVPFAIGDVLYVFLVFWLLRSCFLFIRKLFRRQLTRQKLAAAPFRILNFGLACYLVFKLLWGFNYARPPINKALDIEDKPYDLTALKKLGGYFILKLDAMQPDRSVYYSTYLLENTAKKAYKKLERVSPLFRYDSPNVKPVLNSWFISRLGVEGYYNPFTGEANINSRLPRFVLPFTVCHEIAHQAGIGREDEANLAAYLTGINSDDVNFRYAAYYCMLTSILYELRYRSPEDFIKFYALLPPQVLKDIQAEKAFWKKYNSQLYGYMDTALDAYLKMNRQKDGIKSYQNIVLWVYNFHKEELERM